MFSVNIEEGLANPYCGHPLECLGKVNPHDLNEKPHCLWCGDIEDMAVLVDHLSTTYDHFTNSRISKPMTLPSEVFAVAADLETERVEEYIAEATEELKEEIAALKAEIAQLKGA